MTVSTPNYVFLPWVRQGAASGIQTPDALGANQSGVAALSVKLRVNDAHDIDRQVRLYGPGDVTGMDPLQVVRTVPCHLALDFEPNYFPAVEFDRPDFPWLFTPARADSAERMRPWLCLVVVRKQEGVTLRTGGALQVLDIKAPAIPGRELPDLSESWAWAHTQVMGSPREQEALKNALSGDPALNVSRLLCPRRMDPTTDYLACVVPAFELGRRAGLGLPIQPDDEKKLEPAWASGEQSPQEVMLPVYYHWEFRTGAGGDFETLARALKARKADEIPPQVGKRSVDISESGLPITPPMAQGTELELEGALRIANSPTAVWPKETRTPFQAQLKEILDEPWQAMLDEPDADPLLAPPIYGCWQAARHTVEIIPEPPALPPSRLWLHELNLDPRHRVAAALGTLVAQAEQEQLMASAWEQLGEIKRINQMLRLAQLGRAVNTVYYRDVFRRLSEEALFNIVAPAQSRLVLTLPHPDQPPVAYPARTLLVRSIAGSSLPSSVVSASVRRLSSPRGAISRRSMRASANGLAGMYVLFKSGFIPSSQLVPEKGAVTIDKVSQGVRNAVNRSGGFIWNPDPPPHWERPSAILMQMLDLFRLVNISGSAVGSRQPPPGTPGELPAALRSHQSYLSGAFISFIFRPRPALDVKNAALVSLDPAKTIQARVNASLVIIGDAGQAGDALAPLMDAPEFPQPMYESLRDLSQDYLFPGLQYVPPDTAMLLETNPKFVESFLVGLNAEMAGELLWRGYPTDQRGTYFRQFWDTSAGDGVRDIERISAWGDRALGTNAHEGGKLVLLLRGELLRRYPNSVIYAVKADERLTLSPDPKDERHPLFRGTLKPDVTFLGFDLTREDAIADPGWFFVIQQQPTEPEFGLDAADFSKPAPALTTWDNLSWRHLADTEAELKTMSHASIRTVLPDIGGVVWGKTAAHQAFITLQRPVRIAIHARQMIMQGGN